LHEDHANARLLAEALAAIEGVAIDCKSVETNIVIFRLKAGKGAPELAQRLKARGVLASAFGPDAIRLVTHRDVSREQCAEASAALSEEIGGLI
jgi:threonine aldolase